MEDKNMQETLDELAVEIGTPVTDEDMDNIKTYTEKEIDQKLNESANQYAYDYGTGTPIPGESVKNQIDSISKIDKKDAVNSMITQLAMMKANTEAEAEKKRQKKADTVAQMMYLQEQEYYRQHHFMMSGSEKRRIRRIIEKKYDAGEFEPKGDKIPLN